MFNCVQENNPPKIQGLTPKNPTTEGQKKRMKNDK